MPRQHSFSTLAKRSFAIWFGSIWLLVGAPFLIIGIYVGLDNFRTNERLQNEAQVTEGMVLNKWISRRRSSQSRRESTSYWVGYRFRTPQGVVVKRETEVDSEQWDRLVEREPVRVTYLPDDPAISRIEGESSSWILPLIFIGLGVVFAPIGGFIFFRGVAGIRRELRLRSGGMSAPATVVEVAPTNTRVNGVQQWRIRYEYQDLDGRKHRGASRLMGPTEAQAWKPGNTGTVHFDPRAPKRSVWAGEE